MDVLRVLRGRMVLAYQTPSRPSWAVRAFVSVSVHESVKETRQAYEQAYISRSFLFGHPTKWRPGPPTGT